MSTQANTIQLDASVIAALREAAEREHRSLEEMAGEAIMRGLSVERDAEVVHDGRHDRLSISRLPDMSDLWRRFPSVDGDSGRFLEEDR